MRLWERLARFNAEHPWSHNDAFSGFVLRNARAVRREGGTIAADVGCGTGNLLEQLAPLFHGVIGIEPDARSSAVAIERFQGSPSVRIEQRPFGDEPPRAYDLIVFSASLHHLVLEEALSQAVAALRPGGRIVIVGVAQEGPRDRLRSVISLILNPIVGVLRHPRRVTIAPAHLQAPTAEPTDSFERIRDIGRTVLPGLRMRRRLFWRFTASWIAPD